jgi:ankyrin repeat protein
MENAKHFIEKLPVIGKYFGSVYEQKLYFVPDAQNEPGDDDKHEVSEAALFRFLLNEQTLKHCKEVQAVLPDMLDVLKTIDKESEITEFEAHQSSMGKVQDLKGAFHVFIVFKTTKKRENETADDDEVYWWSLEKGMDYITLQRSSNKENVKDKCYGEPRNQTKPIVENLIGKGTIKDLFAVLWAQQVIPEEYNILNSNCQSFVTFVSTQITQDEYKFEGFFPYSPPESDRKTEMLDLTNLLTDVTDWHPLFTLIFLENTRLFDTLTKGGEYNMGITQYGVTLLNHAIVFSKTKMVELLLNPPYSADPTIRDEKGRNALEMAAVFTEQPEIFDLLLAHEKVKIDDVDESGRTALYAAAYVSNVAAVKHLLASGANFSLCEKYGGRSPLHQAASINRRTTEILDLILEAKKAKTGNQGIDDVDDKHGMTALHCAAAFSNEITAEHLIEKGADVNRRIKDKDTPLHYAAFGATDMKIIDLLLENIKDGEIDQYKDDVTLLGYACNNKHGLEGEIIERLVAKGIFNNEQVQNPQLLEALNAVKQQVAQYLRSKSSNGLGGAMANRMEEAGSDRDKQPYGYIEATYEDFRATYKSSADVGGIEHFIGDNAIQMEDKVGQVFKMALKNAIEKSDVEKARCLSKQFEAELSKVTWRGGRNALHAASHFAKTTDLIDVILERGKFDINGVDTHGKTALFYAINARNVITVGYLLEKGADPTIGIHRGGITQFHAAAALSREPDILDLFLANNKQFDIDHRNQSGLTALHMAIRVSNTAAAKFLLSNGANPNAADENGYTPLHVAAKYAKDMDIVELLLDRKDTNVDYLDNEGNNALHYAMGNEHGLAKEIANLLREKMAAKSEGSSHEPKNIATLVPDRIEQDSDIKTIRILIENGQDVSAMTWGENGANALHVAAAADAKTTDLIDLILETGKFDINGVDSDGNTPLHYAILAGSNAATNAHYLLKKKADPTVHNNEKGLTPFHTAAALSREPDILGLFLVNNKQFDIDHRNQTGMTALHMAIKESNKVTAEFLLSNGANPNAADENGFTPLHVAAYYAKDMDIVKLLVNRKDVNVNYSEKGGHRTLRYAKHNMHGLGEAIANLLREKMAAKTEGSIHEPENMAATVQTGRIKEDSDIKTIRLLIENGQDISAMTWGENGANALHLAAANEETTELIDIILETGKFDINGVDNDGRTPLHYAIKRPKPITINVRRLIKMGANTNIADKNGVTPLHMVARNAETMDLIEIFLKTEKLNVNDYDHNGLTALAYARSNKHGLGQRIIGRLRESGAKE